MADFLLELLSEEIPARMQAQAGDDLNVRLRDRLGDLGFHGLAIHHFATPRRLAVIVRDLPAETPSGVTEIRGPRTAAPQQAFDGFLRSTGLTKEQLEDRDGVWFAVVDKPGRATAEALAEIVPELIQAFPWPKSMRWGEASVSTESPRWVRPLHGIVALLGEDIVEFEIAGIKSGAATVGHRFHHPGIITIGGAHDYAEKLRACHVVLDPAERRRIIAEGAAKAAAEAGLALIEDEGLLAENAGLTEWPVPLLGAFDPAFLDVPREVIQLTMRTNQKYFACVDGEGALAPNFVCVANIEASDGGAAIVEGNRKVLAARLADAKFFWEQDLKVPLADQAEKLGQIVFHEKLGTVADKVERVAKLARWLVEENIVTASSPAKAGAQGPAQLDPGLRRGTQELADMAETAARLAKADLVTGLVGEFPELQGVIGGHLARAQGLDPQIADAIRDHYKPVGQGDEVPTAPVTVAVSLADKLDTIIAFYAASMPPSGSKDPYALRRAALGSIFLLSGNRLRVRLVEPINRIVEGLFRNRSFDHDTRWNGDGDVAGAVQRDLSKLQERTRASVLDFFADRLKVQQREAGVRHDLIDAVFALGGEDDLVRLLARVTALQAFVETAEGADLLAGYKRAANILKKEGWPASPSPQGGEGWGEGAPTSEDGPRGRTPSPYPLPEGEGKEEQPKNKTLSYRPEKEEGALIAALDSAGPRAAAAVAAEDFEGAMAALASLRAPVDAFFDKVTVNDPDPARRAARLDLLARVRDSVHRVADFSKIEG